MPPCLINGDFAHSHQPIAPRCVPGAIAA
jgi:hypothetical protein